MASIESPMISEWPMNLLMILFNGDTKRINYVVTDNLDHAVKEIPEGEFLILRYKNGLTVREVGERLGVTHSAARSRIEKGIRRMAHPDRIKKFYNGNMGTSDSLVNKFKGEK